MYGMTRHFTYANVIGTIALVLAMSTTAYAAIVLTGKNVKDGTIAAIDVKDGSLSQAELSAAGKAAFVGAQGGAGSKGWAGSSGTAGPSGPDGIVGSRAKLVSRWASASSGLVRSSGEPVPNDQFKVDWDSPSYSSFSGGPFNNMRAGGQYTEFGLTSAWQPIVRLTDMPAATAPATAEGSAPLSIPWGANLNATGSLTFLHRNHGESVTDHGATAATRGTRLHDRIMCKLAYGAPGTNPTGYVQMGVPTFASSNVRHELRQVSLIGDANAAASGVPAGNYNVAVLCRDPDARAGSTKWSFVSGNLSAVASGGPSAA